jgi:exonuclease SbcC
VRLHRLDVTAFGPFAGAESVDFDALAEGGLFLLHGPTGAGKTSVLDAVCFALYGQVPGARRTTLRLRSDHAAPTAVPQVRLEFSVGRRRFEVTRSPAWDRPKKRGSGTTPEQARVAVRELVAGTWEALTARIDEAAHLLEELLGLGADQFTKLVLLPQGEFAAFLRADADERKGLLEKLFGTDRFAAIATWVRERRAEQRQQVDAVAEGTRLLLARAAQAVEPLGRTAGPVPGPADDDEPDPAEHLAALRLVASTAAEQALVRRVAAQARLETAGREHAAAVSTAALRAEHAALVAARDDLLASAPEVETTRRLLRDAVRAEPVAALAAGIREAVVRREEAAAAVARRTAAAGPVPAEALAGDTASSVADLDDDALRAALDTVRQRVGELAAVAEDAAVLAALETDVSARRSTVASARSVHDRVVADHAAAAARLAALRVRLAEVTAVAAGRAQAEQSHRAAGQVFGAAEERDRLTATHDTLTARATAAGEAANTAMRAWLDARERRLDGMAAELAAALADGGPCPVCGSCEHPRPATPGEGPTAGEPVTAQTERTLEERHRSADAARAAATTELAAVTERLAAVVATADGRSVADARTGLREARARLEAAEAATTEAATLTVAEPALAADVTGLAQRVTTAAAACEQADADLSRLAERAEGLRERVDRARGTDATVPARRDRLRAWAEAAETVLDARRGLAEASAASDRETAAAATAAHAAGFDDVIDCVRAVLSREQTDALTAGLKARDDEFAGVTARLEDVALAAAAAAPEPRPEAAAAALELARADEADAVRVLAHAEEAVRALDLIAADLTAHLRRSAPVRERFAVLDDLSRCLDGTGGENSRRMPLSAFVLAARLEQVAEAASLRLAQMSAGRYALVHSDVAEKGARRAGLSLQVVDEWTGQRRDTASLSGGEAFYTSLALALGLADVVSAEAGGTTIETLFVDEGFGSLDEDTLEEVMDVLDDLRSGGRVVGLVSHVADLRDRMPARLEVVKGRTGSTLKLAVGA